jgi:hypothetical protein
MAFVIPAIAAGVSATCALGFYTYTSSQTSREAALKKATEDAGSAARRETLAELLRFGPRKLERMCLEAGVRFVPREGCDGDEEDDEESAEERIIYEALLLEMTALLKDELRKSLRPQIEAEICSELRASIMQDPPTMGRLREEARVEIQKTLRRDTMLKDQVRDEVKNEFKTSITRDFFTMNRLRDEARHDIKRMLEADTGLRDEVRNELKKEIKRQWAMNGQETALIQEAKADLWSEEREKMKQEIKREVEGRHASEVKQLKMEMAQLESRLAIQQENTKSGRFLEENSSVWSADNTKLAPTRRR